MKKQFKIKFCRMLYFEFIIQIVFLTIINGYLKIQGRRKRGAEGANAPSIFGKSHHLTQILGDFKIFATIASV